MNKNLEEPIANIDQCYANEEVIHKFGVFSKDSRDNQSHYDLYSKDYDMMQSATGFNDPYELVKVFMELGLAKDLKIIDFGCGTGLLGEYLQKGGYQNTYGIDGSKDMLTIANTK